MHLTWNNFIFYYFVSHEWHTFEMHAKNHTSISITCTPSISKLQFPAWQFSCFFELTDNKTAYRMQCWSHKTIYRHQVEFPFEWQRIIKMWYHKMDQRFLNMPPALSPIHRLSIQILIYHRCKCKPFSKYKYNVNIAQ